MDMLKLSGIAITGALAALLLRQHRNSVGTVVALAAGVMIILLLLQPLQDAVQGLSSIARSGGLSDGYLTQLMKVGGVSLLTDFAAQTCRDAGETGLAVKVELAGRVLLIGLALPFMEALLTQIMSLAS